MRHPVKLVLSDDLARTRATVAFRLLLAIPHLVWLCLWAIAVTFVTIANWFAILASGAPWGVAHRFASRFVRYVVHVYAYLFLLADPYPRFDGEPGYPVDVELPAPERQNRWTVAFRIVLVLPALLLASALGFGSSNGNGYRGEGLADLYYLVTGGLLTTVALLAWFAILARARMPRGLRDAGAYGLAYGTQVNAYLLLLTDRYPNSDPLLALPELPAGEHPIRLDVEDDRRRRRATTFFRLLLAIPHLAWMGIWGIAVLGAAIASWFVQVVAGRPHPGLHRFISKYLNYVTHVYAYTYLVAEPYPEFDGRTGAYPVELTVAEPQRQSRLTVAFRLVLFVPAFLLTSAYAGVAFVASVLGWFAVLVRGEMPLGLRNTIALWLRYNQEAAGYVLLLTERYPYSGPIASGAAAEPEPPVFLPPTAAVS